MQAQQAYTHFRPTARKTTRWSWLTPSHWSFWKKGEGFRSRLQVVSHLLHSGNSAKEIA